MHCRAASNQRIDMELEPLCPTSGIPGQPVKLATIKALLQPHAMIKLEPSESFFFCPQSDCETVYFSQHSSFNVRDVRVPVFQKDHHPDVPICSCFGFTRGELQNPEAARRIETEIRAHIAAKRCACDVRNPQGRCCLSNVTQIATHID